MNKTDKFTSSAKNQSFSVHISKTVHLIYFTLGRRIVGDPRTYSAKFGTFCTNKTFNIDYVLISEQTTVCTAEEANLHSQVNSVSEIHTEKRQETVEDLCVVTQHSKKRRVTSYSRWR